MFSSPRSKFYLIIGVLCPAWLLFTFVVMVVTGHLLVFLACGAVLFGLTQVASSIRCPNCNRPIALGTLTILGMQMQVWTFPPKQCLQCRADLSKKAI
jgi:hypothetical protein